MSIDRYKKNKLLGPEQLHALSFYSKFAVDGGFFPIYETAQYDEITKKSSNNQNDAYQYVNDNGLVDYEGKKAPYSRKSFVDNPHYACIGCSYTVSKGLPVEYSWPSIVQLFTGKTVNNYSETGVGYRKISSLMMDGSTKFGLPKHVLALLPDPYRVWFPYSWTRDTGSGASKQDIGKIIFGHAYWEETYGSYFHNHMTSGDSPLRLTDHMGKKHVLSPEVNAFSNLAVIYSLKKMLESMEVEFSSMTWFCPENPEIIDAHDVFTIKRNANLNLETSTSYIEKFREIENQMGGDGRWRRHGASSRVSVCDHIPLTENQERFWYKAIGSSHPGLHDQIHYAEQLLDEEIPASILKEMQ